MAVKYFSPGTTQIQYKVRHKPHKIPAPLADIPGGLYPLRMSVWNTDEYRIANGWPISVPECDVMARTLVSADGDVLSYRPGARTVSTNANVRWIADDDSYNVTDLQWVPYQADAYLLWQTASDYAPTYVTGYEYRIGSEVFYADLMNFDADSAEHMWADLGEAIGGAAGYTVLMTLSLNSVYGNNQATPYSGLWCPGQATPAPGVTLNEPPSGGWVSLTVQGSTLYLETDQTPRKPVLGISHLLSTSAPVTIALVMDRPTATIYAGKGPSSISKGTVATGQNPVALDGRVVLGRSNGDTTHTQDMMLLDLGLYADTLTPAEIRDEFALLSSVYGGDK